MQLTKHAHACVTLAKDGGRLVIDPGVFTPDADQAVAAADAVLITHEHFDHFDEDLIARSLDARPELRVYGPASVVERWSARPGRTTAVAAGDAIAVAGFEVRVFGELHAAIHRDIERVSNVGYLVDGRLYHPGDAYHVPDTPVDTLLLPTSGPWTKLGEAADYVREVAPTRVVQIHEAMLSQVGQSSTARILSPEMLTATPLEIVPVGETVAV
ncbi:MBL fold metallo-hydrolase [Streptomyces sp. TLI_171]|uniref:MBL fold metallo-hydrolase n=1 Tax=Streptomyces sp. TLI_171 TaxID=1938859 RepID=UPI000C199964|nr:MBL fold metallo-hydrolase [Streptomyces sp. TLI_171]RKE17766.1 L-ascorbate metabolism protein UlaG (beta-lactamase superfamily) [Streptomyces sp. TLI_171]